VLLDEPDLVGAIVAAVRRAVPAALPVSAKMRLGHRDSALMLDNALAIRQPHGPALDWAALLPLVAQYWQHIATFVQPKHCAGRLKQWLNLLRRRHTEAQLAFDAVRTISDPSLVSARLFATA